MAKIAMPSANAIRLQIETLLADRIPSALTPSPRTIHPIAATGIAAVDDLLHGGLPLGAITEITGDECSGRSSIALSFLAQRTSEGKICAWIDVSNALTPEAAAAAGADLSRLLWVRCGAREYPSANLARPSFQLPEACLVPQPAIKGLYSGGWGAHPRSEVKGLPAATGLLLQEEVWQDGSSGQQTHRAPQIQLTPAIKPITGNVAPSKPWGRLDQALRVTDLLLQCGGFGAIVLDMAGIAPDSNSRIPLATWFRYRAGAERSQASILLLTQHPCAKSSAELVLRLRSAERCHNENTVLTGLEFDISIERQRFVPSSNVVPLRKPPRREINAQWSNHCSWAGRK